MIQRPPFETVPLAVGLAWRGGGGYRYEEKLDGVWTVRRYGEGDDTVLAGELLRDGRFYAFDCLAVDGQDIRRRGLDDRLAVLDALPGLLRPAVGNGGEFLEAVLARGGEGVVAKPHGSPFGATWYKCKRLATYDCTVADVDLSRGSVRLSLDGTDAGWLACREFDRVSVGTVIEVAAYGRHASGKFREARFIRVRQDKISPA